MADERDARQAAGTLRVLRLATGLSLRDAAALYDGSPSYLSRVERGLEKPRMTWVAMVAAELSQHLLAKGAAA